MSHRTLSIDQSFTCTGIVILGDDEEVLHFECIKTTNDESLIERISIITSRIVDLYNEYDCDHIVSEALSYGSIGDATRNLAGLLFSLEVKLYESMGINEIPKIAPTTVKKFGFGHGGSKKQKVTKKMMMDALEEKHPDVYAQFASVYKRSGKYGGIADLTDAYFIGKYYLKQMKCACQVDELKEL